MKEKPLSVREGFIQEQPSPWAWGADCVAIGGKTFQGGRLAVKGWRSKAGEGWARCTCLLYYLTPRISQALTESPPAQRRLLPLTLDRLPQQALLKCVLSDSFACQAGRLARIVCHLLVLNIWQLLVNYLLQGLGNGPMGKVLAAEVDSPSSIPGLSTR